MRLQTSVKMIYVDSTNYTAPPLKWRDEPVWSDYIQMIDSASLSHRASSVSELWGATSMVHGTQRPDVEVDIVAPNAIPPVKNYWTGVVIAIIIVCLYNFILYRYRRNITAVVKISGNIENSLTMLHEQPTGNSSFLFSGAVLTILSTVLILFAWFGEANLQFDGPLWHIFAGLGASIGAVLLYISITTWLIRWVADARDQIRQIRFLSSCNAAVSSIIMAPVILVIAMSEQFFELGVIICAGLYLFHVFTLYKYFAVSGFSKLQLILYLCTVEILPVSYIIALAVRESGIK